MKKYLAISGSFLIIACQAPAMASDVEAGAIATEKLAKAYNHAVKVMTENQKIIDAARAEELATHRYVPTPDLPDPGVPLRAALDKTNESMMDVLAEKVKRHEISNLEDLDIRSAKPPGEYWAPQPFTKAQIDRYAKLIEKSVPRDQLLKVTFRTGSMKDPQYPSISTPVTSFTGTAGDLAKFLKDKVVYMYGASVEPLQAVNAMDALHDTFATLNAARLGSPAVIDGSVAALRHAPVITTPQGVLSAAAGAGAK